MSDNVCYQVSSSINRHKFKGLQCWNGYIPWFHTVVVFALLLYCSAVA